MFLTDADLFKLTGYQRPTCQRRWLERNGIPHYVNAKNKVIVFSNWDAEPDAEPAFIPSAVWLKDNEAGWRFSIDTIRASKQLCKPSEATCESGVYFLFAGDDLQYVGLSRCISDRLYQHWYPDRPCLVPADWFDSYSVIEVPYDYALNVETYYIYSLKPPRNVKYVPLTDVVQSYLES